MAADIEDSWSVDDDSVLGFSMCFPLGQSTMAAEIGNLWSVGDKPIQCYVMCIPLEHPTMAADIANSWSADDKPVLGYVMCFSLEHSNMIRMWYTNILAMYQYLARNVPCTKALKHDHWYWDSSQGSQVPYPWRLPFYHIGFLSISVVWSIKRHVSWFK